ncbi:MAG: hypothetical protein LBC87_00550 [Fibromonadaceae bacterium]|jgi:hypothetical protein|nr:hypothetical protein [Fibromonadaceae bacterium]
MNINGYGILGAISGYGTKSTSQTSSKPFTIPVWGENTAKTDNDPKTNKRRDFTLTKGYDPFKDMAKTGNVKLLEYMQTKTEPKRSDEEILKEIEELAKEHARTGQFQNSDPRFSKLMDEYISSASPDRAGILKSETNEMLERLESEMYIGEDEDPKKNKELVDYLMEVLGIKKREDKEEDNDIISNIIAARGNNIIAIQSDGYYTAVDYDRGEGRVTTLTYDNNGNQQPGIIIKSDMYQATSIHKKGVIDHALFYDGDAETIIMIYNKDYDEKKLTQIQTNAESLRKAEILSVYNATYDFTYGRHIDYGAVNIGGNVLYSKAGEGVSEVRKEVYNKTYERLMSGII